jgi:hypothetical protein
MKFLKYAGACAALALTAGLASAASATVYNLNVDGSSGGSFPGSAGTVTVTSAANGGLTFDVSLISPDTFHSNGGHTSFAFTLNGDASGVALSGLTTNNSATWSGLGGPGSFPDPSIGSFEYGLDCSSCSPPDPSYATTLHFTVTATDHSTLSLVDVGNGVFGAANLRNGTTGNTGAVGFTAGTPGVPEPATWAMLIVGMGMVGAGMRMRRRSVLTPA